MAGSRTKHGTFRSTLSFCSVIRGTKESKGICSIIFLRILILIWNLFLFYSLLLLLFFSRVWNFLNDFRQTSTGKNWTSLPQFFKNHGYNTIGLGKLYHPGRPYNNDMPLSWTSYPSDSTNSICNEDDYADDPEPSHGGGNFCPDGSSAPNQFSDVNVTKIAVATLQQITATASETPWFLGLGWHYPHQPWHVPLDFVDLYPNPVTGLDAPTHPYSPIGMPDVAVSCMQFRCVIILSSFFVLYLKSFVFVFDTIIMFFLFILLPLLRFSSIGPSLTR